MNESYNVSRAGEGCLFIPHRAPMVLVQELERADGDGAFVRAEVPRSSMFAREDGTVEHLVLLEIIAQACAAFGGLLAAGETVVSDPDEKSRTEGRCIPRVRTADGDGAPEAEIGPAVTSREGVAGNLPSPHAHTAFAPKAAFLVGVRFFEIEGTALADEPLFVDVALIRGFGGFLLFEGVATQCGRRLAKASLKAYQPGGEQGMQAS